jgi:hypothetical protein
VEIFVETLLQFTNVKHGSDPKNTDDETQCWPSNSLQIESRCDGMAWFLVNDRVKLLAYRIFDPAKANVPSKLTR